MSVQTVNAKCGLEYCLSAVEALQGADACLVLSECPLFADLDEEFDLMRSE